MSRVIWTAVLLLAAGPAMADVAPSLGVDLSPMAMFRQADLVVRSVMVSLVFASAATWIVLLAKRLEITLAIRRMRRLGRALAAREGLSDALSIAGRRDRVGGALLEAARDEIARAPASDGVKERIAIRMGRIEMASVREVGFGVSLLATIGATAPFVGLFGTVWGIMNSFIGIAKTQTTSLAVVAPGIAEALLATAIGLVAAIPAVIFYNHLGRAVAAYRAALGDTVALVTVLASRALDGRT